MEFQHEPQTNSREGAVGEQITKVHGVGVYELEQSFTDNEKVILNYGNPVFSPDELREIADAAEDFYSEPTFEERVEDVADEFGLYVKDVNTYESDFPSDASVSWTEEDDFDRTAVFEAYDEFCSTINFYDNRIWLEK